MVPSYTTGGNVNCYSHYGQQYGGSLKKLKIALPYNPAIHPPPPGHISGENHNMKRYKNHRDFPGGSEVKPLPTMRKRPGFDPWVRKIPWRGKWQHTPELLPGKFCELQSMG